ncbi:hypothetical protein P879_03659 [Paragonimus westermani]|uniref:Band 3 cytoplasmic domain-containing protein n=1 Tax=Paragonimus westermani TaxID=34504 RepID=A0A8T0DRN4_9TREM|nr:hypothetical protein P879_03659 [Paragonimus westermani]
MTLREPIQLLARLRILWLFHFVGVCGVTSRLKKLLLVFCHNIVHAQLSNLMSHTSKLVDEPVVDSGAQYCVGALSEDEIKGHRSKPTMPFGLPSVDEGVFPHDTGMSHGITTVHRHRRRRKRFAGQTSEGDNKMYPTDPSEHVMFLLGECDGEEDEPHHLFCELDELWHDPTTAVETEWREAARWIKFEEAVEENGERWSKPHVATLPLFSLFELRNCLTNAVIMLNLEAYSMEQVADLVLNVLISENHLPAELRDRLLDVLLLRHIHLHDRNRGRIATNLPLIRSVADIGKRQSSKEVDKELTSQHSLAKFPTFTGIDNLDPSVAAHGTAEAHAHAAGHSEALSGSLQGKYDLHFLKKIAPGSETANILVGETTFLTEPISVFVRLHEAVLLGDLTEVPVPTRFLFLHLGVMGNALKYREIGRSMGVLMSDEVFHDVAYKAKSRVDLLAGLDEFLSVAIVLPPGEWDPSIRIEPPPSVPSQDSRKTGVAPNGSQTAPVSTVSQPDQGMVLDQLCAGGDRLAGLCLAAIGSVALPNLEEEKELGEPTGTTKVDGRGADSNLDLNAVEAVGGLATGVHDEAPRGHGLDPSLQRTGRLFGGLVKDIKRRAPFYLSDFTDALHVQCCASFIFLYFACLTPIITFGGLLSQATGGYLVSFRTVIAATAFNTRNV